jgi:hypothetical protein
MSASQTCRAFRLHIIGMTLIGAWSGASATASAQRQTPAPTGPLKQFTYSDKANPRLAKTLSIPVYFALPASARGPIPADIRTTDTLIDFKHPDVTSGEVGLRIIETKRAGMSQRLGQSGLFQTGDLLLSFWPDWGGAGSYPNIQMGVSHVGVAYVKDGKLHNIDNPLTEEYNGRSMRGDLTSDNYKQVSYLHVIRPRGLTDAQRANLLGWITRFNANARSIYPKQLAFNSDYNAPKYKAGQPVEFVKRLAQTALGQHTGPAVELYCSEFAWSLLSLRNCDPDRAANAFNAGGVPSCVNEPMRPMLATGDYMSTRSRTAQVGLADGPLMVIDAMNVQGEPRQKLIDSVFAVSRPEGLRKMSSGHRDTAKIMQPKFAALAIYYAGVTGNAQQKQQATAVSTGFAREIPQNYSPTSFLINTLLPQNNPNRTMDYIATIVVK